VDEREVADEARGRVELGEQARCVCGQRDHRRGVRSAGEAGMMSGTPGLARS
jgi:hypothetical protein